MFHDRTLARRRAASRPERPPSAVGAATGLVGMVGLASWIVVACLAKMDGPYAALTGVAACALPMTIWAVLVDKVHRHATTGLDWAMARPWRDVLPVAAVRLVGLWAAWAAIAIVYLSERFYWDGSMAGFPFAMWCLGWAAPVLVAASVPYTLWLGHHLVEPRDGAYAFGAWLLSLDEPIDHAAMHDHWRGWAVKGFFLAFMLAIVPPGFAEMVRGRGDFLSGDPVRLGLWLIGLMFVVDCAFATAGYVLTLRPLDAHIRSANPFAGAWTAALICYPPFAVMESGGALDYGVGTRGGDGWAIWLAGHPPLLWGWAAMLVALTAVYAWATVAFGFRFSNLTNRGVLTHGPYALSRHPAYLSKNLFWWLSTLPMLSTGSWGDAARACALMGAVSGVYYWRARTEERHLSQDPAYQAYSAWASVAAPVPRLMGWVLGRPA
jgi:protein-S-isoprenylcysteine O-methyltransferase Ste14